jgi:SAM-dependent methyltransferase
MTQLSIEQKYADPAVVTFWQRLAEDGLQQSERGMVSRYLPPSGNLLDLGCGAGRAVLGLGQLGYTVSGIDLSLPMLLAGRSLSREMRLSAADLLALPFGGEAFSATLMFFGALQHIPSRSSRQRALQEMARVVKPGGHLILGLDNLAPTLLCYAYWLKEKLLTGRGRPQPAKKPTPAPSADKTLWAPNSHPLVWHARGIGRTLRWRTWPGLVDLSRRIYSRPNGPEPGDTLVAQFSRPAPPGQVYYHIYRVSELAEDAALAGWTLLNYHTGRELSEERAYPRAVRQRDKQLFFAFQKK